MDEAKIRELTITTDYIKYPEGYVLIEMGQTKVIWNATIEEKIPPFLRSQNKGWVTAEYSMLPRATERRNIRESSKGKVSGRTMEIQRLIGRALRSVIDLDIIGERTVWIECDVIQVDGGTRTASISGAFVALCLACEKLLTSKKINQFPITDYLGAISVGVLVDIGPVLDLDFEKDEIADDDMNVIMTGEGKFVEIQGTGEEATFSYQELQSMLQLAEQGINQIFRKQKEALGDIDDLIENK